MMESLLREWDVDPDAKVSALSVGERQKVAVIQAMGHEPDLFVLDEPVASLDPVARRQFIRQMIDLNARENKTVLFSTHITSDLERVAADIALLKYGEISFEGDLSTLKDRILKLRIQGDHDLPEPLPVPNMIHCHILGNQAVVTTDGLLEREIQGIEQALSATIAVERMNLEDIFLELNK